MSVKANYKTNIDDLINPGDFMYGEDVVNGVTTMYYVCPCGKDKTQHQGGICAINIGLEKPTRSPSWKWDGNREEPTLLPSINDLGCGWHGYLRKGVFDLC